VVPDDEVVVGRRVQLDAAHAGSGQPGDGVVEDPYAVGVVEEDAALGVLQGGVPRQDDAPGAGKTVLHDVAAGAVAALVLEDADVAALSDAADVDPGVAEARGLVQLDLRVRTLVHLDAVLRGAAGLGHDRAQHLDVIAPLGVDLVEGAALDRQPGERHVVGQDVHRGPGGAPRIDDPAAAALREHAQRLVDDDRLGVRPGRDA